MWPVQHPLAIETRDAQNQTQIWMLCQALWIQVAHWQIQTEVSTTTPPSPPYPPMNGDGLTLHGRRCLSTQPGVGRQYGVKGCSQVLLLLLHALWARLAVQEQGFAAGVTFDNFNRSGHLLCYQAVIFRPPDDLAGVVSTVGDFKVLY